MAKNDSRTQFLKEAINKGLTGRVKTAWVSAQVANSRLVVARDEAREAARKKAEIKATRAEKARAAKKKKR